MPILKRQLTLEDCQIWRKKKNKNPISNYKIDTSGIVYNEIKRQCEILKSPLKETKEVEKKEEENDDKLLKRKFPDYYIGIRRDDDIEISAGRKEYVSDITQIIGICNQLGWFISFGTKDNKDYNFDENFAEQTFDEIVFSSIESAYFV